MVKKIFSVLAIAAAAFAVSCSQVEEDFSTVKDGGEVSVSFTTALPEIATRAYSDGKTAKKLYWAVYPSGEEGATKTVLYKSDADIVDLAVTVETYLAVGKTYDILFWAADENNPAYGLDYKTQSMTVDYSKLTANNDSNDAFFAFVSGLKVTGMIEKDVTLTRPFAQINLGTDDYAKAKERGLVVAKTGLKAELPTVLNLADGSVNEAEPVEIPASFPGVEVTDDGNGKLTVTGTETFPVDGYQYLEMNYILADATKSIVSFEFTVYEEGAEEHLNPTITVANVPVQRNYRTNIYGSLLTDPANFMATIDKAYIDEDGDGKPDDYNVPVVEVLTIDDVPEAIEKGAEYVKVQEAPTAEAEVKLPAVRSTESEKEVTIALPATDNKITFSYESESDSLEEGKANLANVNISAGSTENIVIDLPESHVTFNGQAVNATVSTSETTLVVEAGSVIESLVVAAGNVTIMKGGEVKKISRADSNSDEETVLRVYEEDMPDMDDDKIRVILLGKIVIGETSYDNIEAALADAVDGDVIKLAKGEYTLPSNIKMASKGSLTFAGEGVNTVVNAPAVNGDHAAVTATSLNIKFKDLKYNTNATSSWYQGGIKDAKSVDFENCTIIGPYCAYTASSFKGCTIDPLNESVFAYGGDCTFEGCTFTSSKGRAINAYNEYRKNDLEIKVTVKDCKFIADEIGYDGWKDIKGEPFTSYPANNPKPITAVEINSLGCKFTVNISNSTATGYGIGPYSNSIMWDIWDGKENVIVTIEGKTVHCPPVEINGTYYSTLEAAFADVKDGDVVKINEGTYEVPAGATGKTLTFVGADPAKVTFKLRPNGDAHYDGAFSNSKITFDNLTLETYPKIEQFSGYGYCEGTYKNCIIKNEYTLYGTSVFENCTFEISGNGYNVWTYGASATFSDCIFNCDGKAVLIYGQTAQSTITFNDCTFNDNGDGTVSGKAAIEVGAWGTAKYEIYINRCTANGFDINSSGISTGTTLWGNKNSMTSDMLNVVIDGKDVY